MRSLSRADNRHSRRERHPDERGLALLDVLLGMAIFALIAVIAVQAMGAFRERAYVTTAVSDAKQVAVALEAARTAPGATSYNDPTVTPPVGVNLSSGVTIAGYTASTDGEYFAVCTEHASGGWALYDSGVGAITESSRGVAPASCTTPAAPARPVAAGPPAGPPAAACPSGTMTITTDPGAPGLWWVDYVLTLPAGANGMKYQTAATGLTGGGMSTTGGFSVPNAGAAVPGASDSIAIWGTIGNGKNTVPSSATPCAPVAFTWPATFGDIKVVTIP